MKQNKRIPGFVLQISELMGGAQDTGLLCRGFV